MLCPILSSPALGSALRDDYLSMQDGDAHPMMHCCSTCILALNLLVYC